MSDSKAISFRSATVSRDTVDPQNRTAVLSFSSEAPIRRFMGDEILLHRAGAADLSRLTTVGAVLYGHQAGDMDSIIGRVVTAGIDTARRRGVATIQFDDDATGAKAMGKVQSGSLRGVSFGYSIKEALRVEEGSTWTDPETGKVYPGPALIATKWEAFEISLTPVPADSSVGVGRDLTRDLSGIKILKAKEGKKMSTKPIPVELLNEILAAAAVAGPECRARVAEMITNGAAEGDLWRTILDALGLSGAPREPSKVYRKFSEIPDDVLARSLIFPQDVDPNPAVARGTQPTAPPMRRDGLPKLSDLDDDALAACLRNPTMLVD